MNALSSVLNALAKLKLNEVPPVDGFAWSVGKVTTQWQDSVMEGIMWTLPKRMFTDIGGRITGSLAVSFIPAPFQETGQVKTDSLDLKKLPIQAHASIYLKGEKGEPDNDILPTDADLQNIQSSLIKLPAKQEFVELFIQPIVPPPPGSK